jgi:hypothetical protein
MMLKQNNLITNKKTPKLNAKTKRIPRSRLRVQIRQVSLVLPEIEKFPFVSVK